MSLWKRCVRFPNKLNLTANIFDIFTIKCFLIAIYLVASISLISFTTVHFSKTYAYSATAVTNNREKYIIKEEEEETNISHILFGIAGSALTWSNRFRYVELWWRSNVTRGFVWLDEKPRDNEPWPETSPPYRVSQNTSEFKYTCLSGDRSIHVRIARIIKESFELGLNNVRWFVMGDDDTFFFTENLVTVLAKYDHNQVFYIGRNAYGVDGLDNMACGGGGFAISYPLAAELVKVLDGCINRYHYWCGADQKIACCVAELGVPLTKELGFHQMDIQGSPRGFLAAHPVAPLVSLHHLDLYVVDPLIPSMSRFESAKKVIEASNKDSSRTLQHSLCYDLKRNWSVSVSWGYSVQLYPWLVSARDLGMPTQTFNTWTGTKGPFTFSTRPNDIEPCKRPIEYYIDQVVYLPNGETLTSYNMIDDINKTCKNHHYIPALAVHTVHVTAAILSPQVWRQAPRRQCCEIINSKDDIGSVLHIRIRGYNH